MFHSNFSQSLPAYPEPRAHVMLWQIQRDNLLRQNRRLVRQIEELTHRIQRELDRLPNDKAIEDSPAAPVLASDQMTLIPILPQLVQTMPGAA